MGGGEVGRDAFDLPCGVAAGTMSNAMDRDFVFCTPRPIKRAFVLIENSYEFSHSAIFLRKIDKTGPLVT
jgi:hypothetical protein